MEPLTTAEEQLSRVNGRDIDPELTAINTLVSVLSGLEPEARSRVVTYVFGRLGIERSPRQSVETVQVLGSPSSTAYVSDVRSFAGEKKPLTAIERTAVVAFYLSEVAPEFERRRSIGQEEVTRYFKQAGFPLPASPSMALVHAKNAGFFELEGPGQYRLNAVGYNLVAHRMPKDSGDQLPSRRPKPGAKRLKGKKLQRALPAPPAKPRATKR